MPRTRALPGDASGQHPSRREQRHARPVERDADGEARVVSEREETHAERRGFFCVGSCARDEKYRMTAAAVLGSSNRATLHACDGGVARNIAQTLAHLGASVALCSAVGNDETGSGIFERLRSVGVNVLDIATHPVNTARCATMLDADGSLLVEAFVPGANPMPNVIADAMDLAATRYGTLVIDDNLEPQLLRALLHRQPFAAAALVTTGVTRAAALRELDLRRLTYGFFNRAEAAALLGVDPSAGGGELVQMLITRGLRCPVITDGERGVWSSPQNYPLRQPCKAAKAIVDVTGAGDALTATTLWALDAGCDLRTAIDIGITAATITIESLDTVAPDIHQHLRERCSPTLQLYAS